MKKLIYLLLVCSLPAVGQQKPNAERMHRVVEVLSADSLLGRSSGTPESAKAAEYIVNQFREIGIEPLSNGQYFHDFSWTEMHRGRFLCRNIVGVLRGADPALNDEYILIGAHYDHIGAFIKKDGENIIYNGADDNASGVAGMLELARIVASAQDKIGRSVIFVAFDAEEKGLWGSTYFVENCPVDKSKIKAMVSMDMIGRADLCKGVGIAGINTAKGIDCKELFLTDENLGLKVLNQKEVSMHLFASDTSPFYKDGIPSILCSTGTKGPYHTPEDRVENIDAEGMAFVVDNMYLILLRLSNCENIKFNYGKQRFTLGFAAGVESGRFSIKHGPLNNKSRLNYSAGFSLLTFITPRSTLQTDVLYKNVSSRNAEGNIVMPSIHIPVVYRLTSPYSYFKTYVGIGGYYNRALDVKIGGKVRNDLPEAKNDYGITFRLGFSSEYFEYSFVSEFGINRIFDNAPRARYRSFGLSVAYYF